MKYAQYLLFSFALFLSACSQTKKIEVKNDDNQLSEVYYLSKDSLKEGTATTFYEESGKVFQETPFSKGKENGIRTTYYPSGKIEETNTFANGEFHGPSKTFYESGKLKNEVNYIHNAMDGYWTAYYDNGQIKEKVLFKDNLENGPFVEYYKNGQLKAEGKYLNGDNEDGLLKLYNDKGMLIKKMECKEGVCRTIWKLQE